MIDYRAGSWGFHVCLGWNGSLAPRALTVALPNAVITFIIGTWLQRQVTGDFSHDEFNEDGASNIFDTDAVSKAAQSIMAVFTAVMIFILHNRSRTSYNRWWEGGTLLQKTRGEWFNAYSSIMAFTSTRPELQDEVVKYCHLMARLFSLLMCCGLQQVSPYRDRPFEIIDIMGIEPASMEFLNDAPDKVEVILQWIQRSMVLHCQSGVLPAPPPILSRAFQEVSRGIVNLQNARKIADFPYPFPLAQVSMVLQLIHWVMTPFASALALPRSWAVILSFFTIFVLWCIHFNALDLEFPFGSRVNDLPMDSFQKEWNSSILTLLDERASRPPQFNYDPVIHDDLDIVMSDASELYVPTIPPKFDKGVAVIKIANRRRPKPVVRAPRPKKPPPPGPPDAAGGALGGLPEHSPSPPTRELSASDAQSSNMRPAGQLGTLAKPECIDISANDPHVMSASTPDATSASSGQTSRRRVNDRETTHPQVALQPNMDSTTAAPMIAKI